MDPRETPPHDTGARLIHRTALPNGYFVARIAAPALAREVQPGQSVIVERETGEPGAPLAVMRSQRSAGWLDLLYQDTGDPPGPLTCRPLHTAVRVRGPIGQPIIIPADAGRIAVLGASSQLASFVFVIDVLRSHPRLMLLALLELDTAPAPFHPQPSRIVVPAMPPGVIAAVPLLEDWGVPSRIADPADRPGCFEGDAAMLVRQWLANQDEAARDRWTLLDTRTVKTDHAPPHRLQVGLQADNDA